MTEIRKKLGKKHINDDLKLTWNWYLTNRHKQGWKIFYKLTSKGEAFLEFVEKAKKLIPEGTSVFDGQLIVRLAILEVTQKK